MDDIDKAQNADATNLSDAIERQRVLAATAPKLRPMGICHNLMCGELFPANDNRLFCNGRCADAYGRATRN